MTLKEFNVLTHDERLFAVVEKGVFLDNYVTKLTRINLYSLDKFYVELVYDGDENKITEVRSFKSGFHLDKYMNKINFNKV